MEQESREQPSGARRAGEGEVRPARYPSYANVSGDHAHVTQSAVALPRVSCARKEERACSWERDRVAVFGSCRVENVGFQNCA